MFRMLKLSALVLAIAGCVSETAERRSERLEPGYTIVRPDGPGPFPTVLLFHGCGGLVGAQGPKQIMNRYAEAANEAGYAAIIVDSFTPRGIGFEAAVSQVCTGLRLRGARRAGDVVAALMYAEQQPFAAPGQFVLAGWSHGGWSVMEAMTVDLEKSWPAGLRRPPADLYDEVNGVYLTYPFCGFPSKTRKRGWARPIPTQIVEAGRDTVAKAGPCHEAFDRMAETGVPFTIKPFGTMTHAFDEEDQTPESAFVYDAGATEKALELFRQFLTERSEAGPA